MQSLSGVSLPSAQLPAPPKVFNAAREDRFAPELERAAKDAERGDDLAGAPNVPAHQDLNRSHERRTTEGKTAEGKTAEGKTAEGKTTEGKTTEGKTTEGKTAEGKAAESKAAEGKAAEGKAAGSVVSEAVTQIVAQNKPANIDGSAHNTKVVAAEAMTVVGTQGGQVASDTAGAADNGFVVENLAQGASVEVEVQSRLKGAELKTELLVDQRSLERSVLDENASKQQLAATVSADESESLPGGTKIIQQMGNGLINLAEARDSKAKVITDPRFAALLNKPEVPATLRQQQSHTGVDIKSAATGSDSAVVLLADAAVAGVNPLSFGDGTSTGGVGLSAGVAEGGGMAEMQFMSADNMHNNPNSQLHSATQAPHAANNNQATEPTLVLKDGSVLPESRVVQQTIEHLSMHARGDSSSVTIKLHPEELGELQLRMVMEGDKLRVHLHTQTQQVQEVLERNFPRLRDALQEAGVNVSDFQVSSDAGESSSQQNFAQNEFLHAQGSGRFSGFTEDEIDPLASVVAATAVAPSDGLSVRV